MSNSQGQCDVWIAGDVYPTAVTRDELQSRLQLATLPDLFIWTLDAAVAAGPKRCGVTRLAFDPQDLAVLRLGKTTLAVTASNHMSDFGPAGTLGTLSELERHEIEHTGAGANLEQAERNYYHDLGCGRVAVLAYAEMHARVSAVGATATTTGVRPFDLEVCLADIREASQQADWVWVILHWGEEFVRFPDPEQRQIAWQLADAGASLVVASHTHVPLGYETRGDSTIFYGLGNFIFPPYREARGYRYAWHRSARHGVIAVGNYRAGKWHWGPREICLSARGLPRTATHGNCPDYGELLPQLPVEYAERFRSLRKRERMQFMLERLCYMSWQERAFRFRRLLFKSPSETAL